MSNPVTAKSPLLSGPRKKLQKATSLQDVATSPALNLQPTKSASAKPNNTPSPPHSLTSATSSATVLKTTKQALQTASVGNFTRLQNKWKPVKKDDIVFDFQRKHRKSKRKNVAEFTTTNEVFDTIWHGYLKTPNLNYNPFVRTSLIRAHLDAQKHDGEEEEEDDDDDDEEDTGPQLKDTKTNKQKIKERADKDISDRQTLPIYNGGNNVTLRKCDRNTFKFKLKQKELSTSWLSFEVWDDKVLTSGDTFIL